MARERRDVQVGATVVVDIRPHRAVGRFVEHVEAGSPGDVGERAVVPVAIQQPGAVEARQVHVGPPVAVVVADGHTARHAFGNALLLHPVAGGDPALVRELTRGPRRAQQAVRREPSRRLHRAAEPGRGGDVDEAGRDHRFAGESHAEQRSARRNRGRRRTRRGGRASTPDACARACRRDHDRDNGEDRHDRVARSPARRESSAGSPRAAMDQGVQVLPSYVLHSRPLVPVAPLPPPIPLAPPLPLLPPPPYPLLS